MYLITRTRKTTQLNEDAELETVSEIVDAHVESNDDGVDLIVRKVKAGDHRVIGVRVFHMVVDEDGVPKIGTEMT